MFFLVRYGEIGLKSPYVVRQLTDRLLGNIHLMFRAAGMECYTRREFGRIFVGADDGVGARDTLRRTFGIVSFSPVQEVEARLEAIEERAVAMAGALLRSDMSFAVRARRSRDQGPASLEVAKGVGRAIQGAIPGVRVDLSRPDVEVFVEVRGSAAYLFSEVIPGPGGLPLGSQGRVVASVKDDRGMAAAWLFMRRGCKVLIGHESIDLTALRRWDVNLKEFKASDLEEIEELALRHRARGIVVGWTLGEALEHRGRKQLPIFHPLVGYNDEELEAVVRRIRGDD